MVHSLLRRLVPCARALHPDVRRSVSRFTLRFNRRQLSPAPSSTRAAPRSSARASPSSTRQGAVVRTLVTDASGLFATTLAPGTFTVRVEASFLQSGEPVDRRAGNRAGAAAPRRAQGRRVHGECRRDREPRGHAHHGDAAEDGDRRRDRRRIARSRWMLTDLLKKNAGVDVIQYNGTLSGIGIRGFRPQVSGINKRYLLLIDGRPSGVTNLATLLLDNVERVEVLKGAASAVYGSSAMGGVVNVISRQSSGPIGGECAPGRRELRHVGYRRPRRRQRRQPRRLRRRRPRASISAATSAWATASSATGDELSRRTSGAGRLGVERGHGLARRGPERVLPGPRPRVAAGRRVRQRRAEQQGRRALGSGDVRLSGLFRGHELLFAGFWAGEDSHTSNVTTFNPARSAVPAVSLVRERSGLVRRAGA